MEENPYLPATFVIGPIGLGQELGRGLFGSGTKAPDSGDHRSAFQRLIDAVQSLSVVGGIVVVLLLIGAVYMVSRVMTANVQAGGSVIGGLLK